MDLFYQADVNADGKLSFEEWTEAFGHVFNPDQLQRLFKDFDTAQTGYLTATEFMEGLKNSSAASALQSSEGEDDLVLDSIPLTEIESVERVELQENVHREASSKSLKSRSPFRTFPGMGFGRALSAGTPRRGNQDVEEDLEALGTALEGWIYKQGKLLHC